MLAAFAARVGLNTLKKQIIAGVIAVAIIAVPVAIRMTVNSWKQDIADKATGEITNAIKDGQIETLQKGKEVDENVLKSDDDDLCALLGGCLRTDPETPDQGDGD